MSETRIERDARGQIVTNEETAQRGLRAIGHAARAKQERGRKEGRTVDLTMLERRGLSALQGDEIAEDVKRHG